MKVYEALHRAWGDAKDGRYNKKAFNETILRLSEIVGALRQLTETAELFAKRQGTIEQKALWVDVTYARRLLK